MVSRAKEKANKTESISKLFLNGEHQIFVKYSKKEIELAAKKNLAQQNGVGAWVLGCITILRTNCIEQIELVLGLVVLESGAAINST